MKVKGKEERKNKGEGKGKETKRNSFRDLLCSPCHYRTIELPPPDIISRTINLYFRDLTVAALAAFTPPK